MNAAAARSDLDYLNHLVRDSARFVEVLRRTGPGKRVPTCPDWDADDLLWHLAEVQWFWGSIAGRGLTDHADVEALDNGGRPADRDGLLALFGRASSDLHHHLITASPDAPAW
ncbi:MAG: maleylpyruvate isomerase N-terminal domain-containing protein, partial [Chloroflexota bacterium]|nr:maleylpyruvate isomerase N-terminal domain-containing protein [Chloroflexota bacterium]